MTKLASLPPRLCPSSRDIYTSNHGRGDQGPSAACPERPAAVPKPCPPICLVVFDTGELIDGEVQHLWAWPMLPDAPVAAALPVDINPQNTEPTTHE